MERELKLQVLEADAWDAILRHPLVGLAELAARPMHALYFDTKDRGLQRAGIAYRLRLEGERWVATLKLAGRASGGLHQRPEWNVQVEGAQADLGVFEDPELVEILRPYHGQPLIPVMETVFERRERCVTDATRGERLLLAADRGEIRAGERRLPILELELELLDGSIAFLLERGADLCASLPLCPESASKFQRGVELLSADNPAPSASMQKAATLRLRGQEPAATALREILMAEVQDCLAALRLDSSTRDRDSFHDLRRAVRQLRALLRFCKPLEHEASLKAPRQALATWFHGQSGRRDRDALLEHWQRHAGEFQLAPGLLTEALLKDHGADREPGENLAAVLLRLWARLEATTVLTSDLSLREYAETQLKQMDRKLLRTRVTSDTAEGRAEFHRLRIRIKNFRYVLQRLAGLWPGKDSKALTKILGHLQESSGFVRDAQMAASHLLPLGLEAEPELALHAGVLWGYLTARSQREEKKFRKSWGRFLETSRPWD